MRSELWFDKTVSFGSPYFGKIICSLYWHLLRGYSFMIGFESFDYTLWLSEKIPATFLQNVSWLQTFSRLLVLLMPDWLIFAQVNSGRSEEKLIFNGVQLLNYLFSWATITVWWRTTLSDHEEVFILLQWNWALCGIIDNGALWSNVLVLFKV